MNGCETPNTYSTAVLFGTCARLAELSVADLVRQAGLQDHFAKSPGVRVTEAQFFAIWDTAHAANPRKDLPEFVGRAVANAASEPVFFAFTCAPDLATGLRRFARYKHVCGPARMSLSETTADLRITLGQADRLKSLPPSFAAVMTVFLNEKARNVTARNIVPKTVTLPLDEADRMRLGEVFGTAVGYGEPTMVYTASDARLPLISRNDALWKALERDLDLEATLSNYAIPLEDRVRACIVEAINDHKPSVAYVCERLNLSRTSLLRALARKGLTFRQLLDETRETLAYKYLQNSDMPIKQIANLLAYRDANAFHRAFRTWTGKTPGAVRRSVRQD